MRIFKHINEYIIEVYKIYSFGYIWFLISLSIGIFFDNYLFKRFDALFIRKHE